MTFLYLKAPNHDFSRLTLAIIAAAREKQVSVRNIQVYRRPYLYENKKENYTQNPFIDIVRETYKDTRSKWLGVPTSAYCAVQTARVFENLATFWKLGK